MESGKTCRVTYEDAKLTRHEAADATSGTAAVPGKLTYHGVDIATADKINDYIANFEDLIAKWTGKGLILTISLLLIVGVSVPLIIALYYFTSTKKILMGYTVLAMLFAVFNCLMVSSAWLTLGQYQLFLAIIVLVWVLMNAVYGSARYSENVNLLDDDGKAHAYGHVIMSHTVGLAILINGAHAWALSDVAYTDSEGSFELFARGFIFVMVGAFQVVGCYFWLYPRPSVGVKTYETPAGTLKMGLQPTQLHERASMLKNSLNLDC